MVRLIAVITGLVVFSACGSASDEHDTRAQSLHSSHSGSRDFPTERTAPPVGPASTRHLQDAGARAWSLRDAGGGGAVAALTVGPYVFDHSSKTYSNVGGDLFAGSDMNGIYALPAGRDAFEARHEGLTFTKLTEDGGELSVRPRGAALHIQGISVAPGKGDLVMATSQGGVIYRSSDRGRSWSAAFDILEGRDRKLFGNKVSKLFFGPVETAATDDDRYTVVVGIGQPKHLQRGRAKATKRDEGLFAELPWQLRFNVLVSEDSGKTWERVRLCSDDCPGSKELGSGAGHVVAIASAGRKNQFWVATLGGLFFLSKKDKNWEATNRSPAPKGKPRPWNVLSVQPSARDHGDVLVLASSYDDDGLLWRSANALEAAPRWENVTGALASGLKAVSPLGPFVKMMRSRSRPSEVVLTGTKNDGHGVFFSRNFDGGSWEHIVHRGMVRDFAGDAWTRFDVSRASMFKGAGEIAIVEDGRGIRQVYVAGFLGMLVRADRTDDSGAFKVRQIHTRRILGSDGIERFTGAGEISLGSSRGGVLTDRAGGSLAVFLYGDNGLFVTRDQGRSFSRPVEDWFLGTGGMVYGNRIAISFSKGNHLDAVGSGGVYYSSDSGRSFRILNTEGLPRTVFTAAVLSRTDERVYGLIPGCGVYVQDAGQQEGIWKPWNEGLPEAAGQGKKCGGRRGVSGGILAETTLNGEQILVVTVAGQRPSETLMFVRRVSQPGHTWHRMSVEISGMKSMTVPFGAGKPAITGDRLTLVIGDNRILTGILTTGSGKRDGYAIRFHKPLDAPSAAIVTKGEKRRAQLEVAGVVECGGVLYAATADGVWRSNLAGEHAGTWRPMPYMSFRSSWNIATDKDCGLYVGAYGGGVFYLGHGTP